MSNRRYRKNNNYNASRGNSSRNTDEYNEESGSANIPNNRYRHPRHLKGREIGEFYRELYRQKEKIPKKERIEELPNVSLPDQQIKEIRDLLNLPTAHSSKKSNLNTLIYDENIQSKFKNDFLNITSTNFEMHLQQSLSTYEEDESNYLSTYEEELDDQLYSHFMMKSSQNSYQIMLKQRQKLPAYNAREDILNLITKNQVILISGETGSGKTTQVPQFILDDALKSSNGSKCKILCTQPRRISAITISERVAIERDELLGDSVGYVIRLENKLPRERGSITYCTTGILLKKMEKDPALNDISHLILDEIHERDVISDITIGILKKILPQRKDLKVILMSATLRSHVFSKYFYDCPTIHIEGMTFPVESFYLEDVIRDINFYNFNNRSKPKPKWMQMVENKRSRVATSEFASFIEPYSRSIRNQYPPKVIETIKNPETEEININLIEELIFYISMKKPPGAILVFLPGYALISKLHTKMLQTNRYSEQSFKIYPLHSRMPTIDQKSVFLPTQNNIRKIIIATNIAETSITINDVVYVIDSGKRKTTNYNTEKHIQTLTDEWVTLANAKQRRGRAGRCQPGVCYHLYTRAREYTLEEYPLPEILCNRLESVILTIKILCLGDSYQFLSTLIDVPEKVIFEKSENLLKRLNALNEMGDLTPLGLQLARLPVDPQAAKLILMAAIFSCVDPITSVAASLSFKDPFYRPLGKEKIVDQIKINFSGEYRSDHLMIANVMNQWKQVKSETNDYNYCRDNFLSYATLNQLEKMKGQFCEHLAGSKFLLNTNSDSIENNLNSHNTKLLKGIICAGLYPNIAKINKIKISKNRVQPIISLITPEDGKVKMFPGSVNATQRTFDSNFFTYYEKQKIKGVGVYLFDTTMVNPWSILFFGDMLETGIENGFEYISIGGHGHIVFNCNKETAKLILDLRLGFEILLEKKICKPSTTDWESEEGMLLKAIIYLISIDGKCETYDDGDGGDGGDDGDDGDDDEDDY